MLFQIVYPARARARTSTRVRTRTRTHVRTLALALAIALAATPASQAATKRPNARPASDPCSRTAVNAGIPALRAHDIWLSSAAYRFPFSGVPANAKNEVLWKKFPGGARKTHYPAPNLPSCRVGTRGTEDRTTRKVGRYFESLQPIDGVYSFTFVDSYGRELTTLHWEEHSLVRRHPERWGWYVGTKWAGHDADRAFEVQGAGCKLAVLPETTITGEPPTPVTTYRWVRDPNAVMVAFNPVLGSPNRRYRPSRTSTLKVRGFVDRRALPDWLVAESVDHDFGCGQTALEPLFTPQPVADHAFKSGYGPGRAYIIGQYFGESVVQKELLPGEKPTHNNMPYNAYNPKPQFGNSTYAMINTTAVAGGGMVRGVVRAGADQFTLYDEFGYCDPNFTLRNMLLRRNGRRVSKWNYFELADFARENSPTVRWVYGAIDPGLMTIDLEAATASANPASVRMYAWLPIRCDR
ncbi:MAG: hypothetical protein HY827_02880 [Actinobacteria bacterium]|nr:hypothetical protein [Actinomycetota bacterium]